jgi:hypothetical protein
VFALGSSGESDSYALPNAGGAPSPEVPIIEFQLPYLAGTSRHGVPVHAWAWATAENNRSIINGILWRLLHDGKRVLFIAEKVAALNVVYDQPRKAGLGDACPEPTVGRPTSEL